MNFIISGHNNTIQIDAQFHVTNLIVQGHSNKIRAINGNLSEPIAPHVSNVIIGGHNN